MINLGKPHEVDIELDICEAKIEEALGKWEAAKIMVTLENTTEIQPVDYSKECV